MTTNLPDDCQRLLDLARDGHDPVGPDARMRVRQAVAASLALSAAGVGGSVAPAAMPAVQGAVNNSQLLSSGSAHATAGGKASVTVFGVKLGALAAAAIVAAGIGLAMYGSRRPTEPVRPPTSSVRSQLPAPTVEQRIEPRVEPLVATPERAQDDEQALTERLPVRKAGRLQHTGNSLSAETALLRVASEALARGDEPAALDALLSHARQFPQGSLREERDGLRAIAECSRDTTPSSASAKRFVRVYPDSMLGARVAKACEGK